MNVEKSIDVEASKRLESRDPNENVYSINQDLQFELSYGVTKISIKGLIPRKLSGKILAFHNDLSLGKLFETDSILKYECQLYGEGRAY